jgi:hypothetical protein
MNLQKINKHKNQRHTKNKKKRQENNQRSISHSTSTPTELAFTEARLLIYEL